MLFNIFSQIVFDFESSSELSSFQWPFTSSVVVCDQRYKHGEKALQWKWGPRDILRLNLESANILDDSATNGGVKLWIYNQISKPSECLTVDVTTVSTTKCTGRPNRIHTSSFRMSLAFTGWRAAWVSYQEFKNCPSQAPSTDRSCYTDKITMLRFHAPASQGTKPIYIDLLRWVNTISLQSRDAVVPIITSQCLPCSTLNSGVTEEDALAMYGRSDVWQQTYRWSLFTSPVQFPIAEPTLSTILSELRLIKKRLFNWYADEKTSFIQLELPQGSIYPQSVVTDFYLQKRWSDLMDNVDGAYIQFRDLQVTQTGDLITGSPLFSKVCLLALLLKQ